MGWYCYPFWLLVIAKLVSNESSAALHSVFKCCKYWPLYTTEGVHMMFISTYIFSMNGFDHDEFSIQQTVLTYSIDAFKYNIS